MKATTLKSIFDCTKKTVAEMGRFKLKVFFSGVASDDGETIVFKDGSKALFLNRSNSMISFDVI